MGFEHRKAVRVQAAFPLYFWVGEEEQGAGLWGQAVNLSESGMAFTCEQALAKGASVLLELSLPERGGTVKVLGELLRSDRAEKGTGLTHRIRFKRMDGASRQRLEQHVLAVADPKLAAATGWGKAYFVDQRIYAVKYRELPAGLKDKWLAERSYLSAKELVYLKAFQSFLEQHLGARLPGAFKILGSRPLKEGATAWLELELKAGVLHCLADGLWSEQEQGERAMLGLQCSAFQKEEALRLEKGDSL
jgi:hypothetical protein